MKKVCATLFMVGCLAAAGLWAQSGQEIDELLAMSKVSAATAARFVMPAAGLMAEDATPQAAFDKAMELGFFKKKKTAESVLSLGDVSFLIMKAFNIKGGLTYRMAPGPHYAARELVGQGIVRGRTDPGYKPDGRFFMSILGRVLDIEEAQL